MNLEQANGMTLQEMIDYAIDEIVEQGGRCYNVTTCLYGDDKGNHCFIGWLLDHDDDDLMTYRGPVVRLIDNLKNGHKLPKHIKENVYLFGLLQNFHDSSEYEIREQLLKLLKTSEEFKHLSFDNPNFQKWVEMGE